MRATPVQAWFPTEADQWANQMEHSLSIGDWITNAAYFCVVSICAPIWEEVSGEEGEEDASGV